MPNLPASNCWRAEPKWCAGNRGCSCSSAAEPASTASGSFCGLGHRCVSGGWRLNLEIEQYHFVFERLVLNFFNFDVALLARIVEKIVVVVGVRHDRRPIEVVVRWR